MRTWLRRVRLVSVQGPRRSTRQQGDADRDQQHPQGVSGDNRGEEATAILWTLWGKQAENAAQYLAKGSHVNVVGRVQNNNYDREGETVYSMAFTAEEVDYLDTKAEGEALRGEAGQPGPDEGQPATKAKPAAREGRQRQGPPRPQQATAQAELDEQGMTTIPF